MIVYLRSHPTELIIALGIILLYKLASKSRLAIVVLSSIIGIIIIVSLYLLFKYLTRLDKGRSAVSTEKPQNKNNDSDNKADY
jgi:hypothetical protein